MKLDLNIPVSFGPVQATIYGGPFRRYEQGTRRLVGVKMAAEIDHPHEISIPTEDFSIPDEADMQEGVLQAMEAIFNGNDIYAGCMGGIGRTGLFMGCMAKVMIDYASDSGGGSPVPSDPVLYVRHYFKPHAIETQEQQDFVRGFDTSLAVCILQEKFALKVVRIVETRVDTVKVYLSPWAWLVHTLLK